MRRQAVEREDIVSSTKERERSEERMGGCKTREGRLRRCYSAMRLICMRSARPNFAQIALHCITRHYNGAPFSHGESEEEVEPEASQPLSLGFFFLSRDSPTFFILVSLAFLSLVDGNTCFNNLRGTSGLELYRELYHTCAYILVYVDTSLLRGGTRDRLLAGRNWPIHVHRYTTCAEVRASSVRELLPVGLEFLGHARQIPVGYIFSVGYPVG